MHETGMPPSSICRLATQGEAQAGRLIQLFDQAAHFRRAVVTAARPPAAASTTAVWSNRRCALLLVLLLSL
eukprot:366245-Chlamydomonas_euryale.AAC.5